MPGAELARVYQVHSAVAVIAEPSPMDSRPQADALVTDRPGLLLGIVTADCAPVLFADMDAGVVGAAHAGWRGAVAGVTDNTIAAMERLGAKRERIVAAVGPCIGPQSYEVGNDFRAAFDRDAPDAERFFRPGEAADKWGFDLPGFVLDRLALAGVRRAGWIGRDTCAEPDWFFSNRRAHRRGEPDYGRLLSAIMLV
jgi:YfiH family protein